MKHELLVSATLSTLLMASALVWGTDSAQAQAQMACKPKILDFYADWCGPCQALKPVLKRLKNKYNGKVDVVSINVDNPKNRKLLEQYGVRVLPTIVYLKSDGQMAAITMGYSGPDEVYWAAKQISDEQVQPDVIPASTSGSSANSDYSLASE